ncbi:hypothetical protein KC992_02845 [Candidatus Saccharibacteria bacterium]|nr:hypothetical protein [Candidatus Saccharibacteria bacterium]
MLRKVRKVFKDKNGKIVLGQKPNLPIIVWFTALLLTKITNGTLQDLFAIMSFGALFTWAWLELFQGVNYFRRALGLLVLVMSIWSRT